MRIAKSNERFVLHAHDLEVIELFNTTIHSLVKPELVFIHPNNADLLINSISEYFKLFYESYDIDSNSQGIVIEPEDSLYEVFMAIKLAFIVPFKIDSFLTHHKKEYKVDSNFIGLIEFRVYDIMENMLPFQNDDRKERIMKWVDENKKNKPVIKKANKKQSEVPINVLKWKAGKSILSRLAKQLKQEPHFCIKQVKDFYNVFDSEQVVWDGSAEFLAYLFYKITTPPYDWVTSASGKPPFTKSVQHYFSFCDNSGKIYRRNDLAKVLNNVTKRSFKKHAKLRKDVDDMIKDIVKGMETK